ncbi:Actin-related protein 5 [Lamellibrachia satsuma]|nr:Actin-related protein 5 [Lamellibrachia satsuma]
MADPESDENVFTFEDEQPVSDPVHQYTDVLRNDKAAIIIDNGSYKCRAGWVTDDQPRLIFKNVLARQRSKKDADVLIGNDISNLEVVRWQLKTQFDRGVVTQYDIQEQVFDYVFTHLGIDTIGCIDHPIVLTEPLCNPNYCRQQMSELLFECYHVPSVLFGIDAMFSLQDSQSDKASLDSLVVSCGYHTTHVMPILGGRLQADRSRRINIGGHHMDIFMQRLLQLKYPSHFAALTLSRAEELMHRHMYMSCDYSAELTQWAQEDYFFSNVHKMQLPYTTPPTGISQTAEQQKERREQQGRRLKDLNAKRREAKLAAEQERLQQLLNLDEMGEEEGEGEEFQKSLSTFGYMSQGELQSAIMKLNDSILRMRQKIEVGDGEGKTDQSGELSSVSSDPKSADLTAEVKRQDIDYRPPGTTMEDWLAGIRKRRQDIISSRIERRQRRSEMTKRRTLASQQRMKIITALAQGTKRKKEDTFGQNDDDWNIYKEISKDAGNSDSEAEQEQLDELEMVLREHDPEFVE